MINSSADITFSREEVHRYSRHFILPEFGARSQKKLKAARVLCIGAGGLGSPSAMYLAAAGIGTLGIVDFDQVDLSNLQRQILHGTSDVGLSKVESARNKVHALNPHVVVETHEFAIDPSNAIDLFSRYDVILDGTDNFATRYLINDACVLTRKPLVSASVFRFEGQISVFGAPTGPCYRCLYPEPPAPGMVPACGEGGVLGVVPGIVGMLQANEAMKLIAEIGSPLIGRLLLFDALEMQFRELKIRRNVTCPMCGDAPRITELQDYEAWCGAVKPSTGQIKEMTPRELKAKRDRNDRIQLVDVREPLEREINVIGSSISIPMSEFGQRMGEFDRSLDIIVYCKVGERSARAAARLQQEGFSRVWNLSGGIDAWIEDVDDDQPTY